MNTQILMAQQRRESKCWIKRTGPLWMCALIALGTVGCVKEVDDLKAGDSGATSGIVVPKFTGPWAAEFQTAYEDAGTDFERDVLQDEVITEAEFAAMREQLRTCLEGKGFDEIRFYPRGEMSVASPDSISASEHLKRAQDCSASSGDSTIGALYFWMKANPAHLDNATIVLECLLREGLVSPDYTKAEYEIDMPNDSVPLLKGKPREGLNECMQDPLGLVPLETG